MGNFITKDGFKEFARKQKQYIDGKAGQGGGTIKRVYADFMGFEEPASAPTNEGQIYIVCYRSGGTVGAPSPILYHGTLLKAVDNAGTLGWEQVEPDENTYYIGYIDEGNYNSKFSIVSSGGYATNEVIFIKGNSWYNWLEDSFTNYTNLLAVSIGNNIYGFLDGILGIVESEQISLDWNGNSNGEPKLDDIDMGQLYSGFSFFDLPTDNLGYHLNEYSNGNLRDFLRALLSYLRYSFAILQQYMVTIDKRIGAVQYMDSSGNSMSFGSNDDGSSLSAIISDISDRLYNLEQNQNNN